MTGGASHDAVTTALKLEVGPQQQVPDVSTKAISLVRLLDP